MNWKNIFSSLTIAANCLLCFFLLFYDRLVVPSLLQVIGRAHPLFLHFPIVLFAVFLVWTWAIPKKYFQDSALAQLIDEWLLLIVAFTAAVTALMGILLSKEAGYSPESLSWHKWSGAIFSFMLLGWALFYQRLRGQMVGRAVVSMLSLSVLVIAGDAGGTITHGDHFLLAPVYKDRKVPLDEAVVYRDMVEPILESKCMSCHNSGKAKGGLVMTTPELLMKGGKSGAVIDTSDANMSLLLQRVHLPEDDKKHMPPTGKTQLNDLELAVLYNWIRRGANTTVKVVELDPTDTLRTIAGNIFRTSDEQEVYDFSAASEDKVKKLNTDYRAVYPLATGSPALAADFYGAGFYKPEQLKELEPVKTQLVSLNLAKMPVTDDELAVISEFSNLRQLDLSFTHVTGKGLSVLGKLHHLKRLSLTNTTVHRDDLPSLLELKSLREVFTWNSGVTLSDANDLRKKYPLVNVQTGAHADTMALKINPPVNQTAAQVVSDTPIALQLKHFVPGTAIRYTLDGSDPDSTHSIVYTSHTLIDSAVLMKARAFRKGWRPSDVVQYQFYRTTFRPDTIILKTPTDPSYMGKGGSTLKDLQKGSQNFGDGKWIAYRDHHMECLLVYPKTVRPSSVTVSALVNVGSMIMPPKSIRVLGGNDPSNMRVLSQLAPAQDTLINSNYLIPYECKFPATAVRYIKVIVEPFGRVPVSQRPAPPPPPADPKQKNKQKPPDENGWFFIDEIFVN